MTAPLDRVLAKLPTATPVGASWRARCPAHRGQSADSLSVCRAEDGRVLLHCHAGCFPEAVLAALGLAARDLFPPRDGFTPGTGRPNAPKGSSRRVVTAYDYVDAEGTLRYQTVRLDPKSFYQRRPDGRGGWVNSLDGVARVLYRLPEVLASRRAVWLPEGEKDADALVALSLTATTTVGGAGAPWLPQYTETLRGRHVVLLADNDAPAAPASAPSPGRSSGRRPASGSSSCPSCRRRATSATGWPPAARRKIWSRWPRRRSR